METAINCTANRAYAVCGIILCALGIYFTVSVQPSLAKHHVSKAITLKDGSLMRQFWSKLPFPYEFHCYLFNVTNPNEILLGEKPILNEIGPFVYDVWQERINAIDDDEDDSVSYTLKKTYLFNPSKSNGLSEEDELTLIHLMYLGVPNAVLVTRPTVLPLISKSIDSLYNKPKSIFVKVAAKEFLFDGYEINCKGVEEFFAKVVCNDVKENWFEYRVQVIEKDFYRLSLWGSFNDTIVWSGRTRINRGINNMTEIGKIIEYNNSTDFSKWDDEKCDKFSGTDGFMFRPFIRKQDHLYKVDTILSRSFDYKYDSNIVHNKLLLYRYTTTLGTDLDTNLDDKCYCIAPDRCLKNGVFELWKTLNRAISASNPHFYLADPYYNNAVIGLNPNKEKHMSTFDVDPLTGILVRANYRVQFNAPLTRQPKYRLLKNISEAQLPIGWFEEQYSLPDSVIHEINQIHFKIEAERFIGYSVISTGLLFFIVGIVLDYMEHRKSNPFLH